MHRFFLEQDFDRGPVIVKEKHILHQMRSVLKLHKGEFVAFFNEAGQNAGFDFISEVKSIEKSAAAFIVRDKAENRRESSKKLVLFQSLIKKDKFEFVLQKATEIGVSEIVPVISARSEKKSLNKERCALILKEAAEQSGRAYIPRLRDVVHFEKAVEEALTSGVRVYFTSTEEKEQQIHPSGERFFNLFIGPEGGWDERELTIARARGCSTISLGRLILRSETAAMAAAYTLLWL
ncbi:16S rRNA (uracil(1498)-N(3))-methyltransferase [Candidatus Giovannonibacteria bacterium]|nr:16S rRNA (uracil(1498)-N(3))-methyltransferase [Candidatus Giovannonibacteria bacterium]